MRHHSFPYSRWTKVLGLVIILAGVLNFFWQHQRKGIFDPNELAVGLSWGLVFIFFSKEKNDDEMMQGLKFRALARGIIVSFSAVHLYNYLFLNWRLERPQGIILSVSAYEFLAVTLVVTISIYYYLKYQVTSTEGQ